MSFSKWREWWPRERVYRHFMRDILSLKRIYCSGVCLRQRLSVPGVAVNTIQSFVVVCQHPVVPWFPRPTVLNGCLTVYEMWLTGDRSTVKSLTSTGIGFSSLWRWGPTDSPVFVDNLEHMEWWRIDTSRVLLWNLVYCGGVLPGLWVKVLESWAPVYVFDPLKCNNLEAILRVRWLWKKK